MLTCGQRAPRGVNPDTKGAYRVRPASRTIVVDSTSGSVPREVTMRRRTLKRSVGLGGVLGCVVIAVLAVVAWDVGSDNADEPAPHVAAAAALSAGSWDFERCAQHGWMTRSTGSGAWHVYADGTTAPDPSDSDPRYPFEAPRPPQGRYAAVTDMSAAGSRILYRDVTLERRIDLRFTLFYDNHVAGAFHAPDSLDHELRKPNQQYRVDVMDPSAAIDSVARDDVLATIFRTRPGDPDELAPRAIRFDLSRWVGKKVRIRFAQVDNVGPLRAGVDGVRLTARS